MDSQKKFEKSFSFEFFPPKTPEGAEKLRATRETLATLGPRYFSVTFGAGGSTQKGTLEAVIEIKQAGHNAAPHLSCIGTERDTIRKLLGTYVENAKKAIEAQVELPAGYNIIWSGQYEYMQKAKATLMVVIPLTLLIIFVIIYMNTKSMIKTGIIFVALPLSLVGCFWYIYLLGYNMSVAVWVGIIALAGISEETGVVMLLYLDLAYELWQKNGRMKSLGDLVQAIHYGAVKRIRPKVMTICVIIAGLVPIMWSHGAGADVMKRIAAPMIGGVVTSGLMELLVFPVIYFMWRGMKLERSYAPTGEHDPKE